MTSQLRTGSRWLTLRGQLAAAAVLFGCRPAYEPPDWSRVPHASGVDPSKLLVDLSADERQTLCEWKVTVFGGFDRRYRERDGCRFATYAREDCRALPAPRRELCTATVADDERCAKRISVQPCSATWRATPECGVVKVGCWGRR